MANLASQQRTYDKNLDVVMQKVYRIFPDPQILTAICTHLIRGNRTTPECFKWYALAVKEISGQTVSKIRITLLPAWKYTGI